MKRRVFVKNAVCGLAGLPLFNAQGSTIFPDEIGSGNTKIRFGICTDTHHDIFPHVEGRLQKFIQAANEKRVDFIIQMGDFCFPKNENKNFMDIWNSFNGPKYHVLGNHDMDICSKEEALDFWGVDKTKHYYSFDLGKFHFIVLDPNNINKNGQYIPYNKGNYFSEPGRINYIDPEQLTWLEQTLSKSSKPTVIFSHQPINQTVSNRKEVLELLRNANSGRSKKVISCFSGHLHKNWYVREDSLNHIQINSMSYLWVGDKYSNETRYPKELQNQYPMVKKMIPYKDALYAFVDLNLNKKEILITGRSSEFIPPGPGELGIDETGVFAPSASIDSRIINF